MSIKWKTPSRFKPALVLKRIDAIRTVAPDGKISYTGLVVEEYLAILQSMLVFPATTFELETGVLIWRALSSVPNELTPEAFLEALNVKLNEKLSVRETDYFALTALSLKPDGFPQKIKVMNCEIDLRTQGYPKKFASHTKLILEHRAAVPDTPTAYCKVVVKVRAKSDASAFHKGMRSLDLLRALLCLMGNLHMQISLGTPSIAPINIIRQGSRYTVHFGDGKSSREGIWYEPGFVATRPHQFKKPEVVVKNFRLALRRIEKSSYKDAIVSSLLRFVRALDQADANSAFLRLWGALEGLVTPDKADYDKLIRRCSFLFKDNVYHRQVLEHLREYRNSNVHAGEESENARIHCFQLQMYYVTAAWYYIRSGAQRSSLNEANSFLDLPPEPNELRSQLKVIQRAIKFRSSEPDAE